MTKTQFWHHLIIRSFYDLRQFSFAFNKSGRNEKQLKVKQ